MKNLKLTNQTGSGLLNENFRYIALLVIIGILIVMFTSLSPVFLQLNNMMNMIRQTSVLAILAIGMTLIILTGGIDLSVGSNIAFAGAVAALIVNISGSAALSIISAVVAAGVIGLINGVMIGWYEISPFMASLATMSLARGLCLGLTDAKSIKVTDNALNWLGQSSWGPVPVVLLLLIVFYFIGNAVITKTVFGRHTYAVGGNARASRTSGVKVEHHIIYIYLLAGLLCGVGAIITVGRVTSAQPWAGLGLEFEVITAVVLGGTSLAGGQGSLKGTLLGAVLVGVLANGLGLMDISPQVQYIVKGIMILIAVIIDVTSIKVREGRQKSITAAKSSVNGETGTEDIKEDATQSNEGRVLELINISKSFPGVKALDKVNFRIREGSVHALVGENGAGKSTLIKVLAGVYSKDEGEIRIDGKKVEINSPHDSQKYGVAVIHQEFSLIPELTVAQNIFLGKEYIRKGAHLLNIKAMNFEARKVIDKFGLKIEVNKRVHELTVGQQQMVEIAKALAANAWVIVMDEPTSALSESDKDRLFNIIKDLKSHGVAVVYISHRMPEIFEIADQVTVLRDGQYVVTSDVNQTNEHQVIKWMVGRELGDIFKRDKAQHGKVMLEVRNLTRKGVFENINFIVHEGEVLGLSGLMGAGRTEIMRCVFGLDKPDSGEIFVDGQKVEIRNPLEAIRAGIGLVPEDRRRDGIIPLMTVRENLTLPSLPWISMKGWINRDKENEITSEYISTLGIKTPSPEQRVRNLSGGNQQKGCLGKCLARNPRVLILDEPTRGIDVGAKAEIHKLIEKLAKDGIAVIMISSELPEILGVSDRIIVLHEGKITGEFDAGNVTQEQIMHSATGIECA